MKKKLLLMLLMACLLGCTNSSDDEVSNSVAPQVDVDYKILTSGYTNLLTTEVKLLGYVNQKDNNDVNTVGFVISENNTPTINDNSENVRFTGDGNFEIKFENLKYNTTYYYRSYLKYKELKYGEIKSFKTCGYNGAAGGIIAYDKGDNDGGWRYLEVSSLQGLGKGGEWSFNQQLITGTDNALGSGKANTDRIISSSSMPLSTAAYKCKIYSLNGYKDWFLPSSDEAHIIAISLEKIGRSLPSYLWTSTEKDAKYAFRVKGKNDGYGFIGIDYDDKRVGYDTAIIPIRRY